MINNLKRFFMAGVPLFAVIFLCGVCYYAGTHTNAQRASGQYVTADKSTVILDAVLDSRNENASEADLKAKIVTPVLGVLQKYASAGYVVVETGKDERGNMIVAAIPPGTRDITHELAAAVKAAAKPAASSPPKE
jgi:hypothetical protein